VALIGRARTAQLRRQMAGSVAAARAIGGAPAALLTAGALRLLADWLGDGGGGARVCDARLPRRRRGPPPTWRVSSKPLFRCRGSKAAPALRAPQPLAGPPMSLLGAAALAAAAGAVPAGLVGGASAARLDGGRKIRLANARSRIALS
jgi:hypothetical protein